MIKMHLVASSCHKTTRMHLLAKAFQHLLDKVIKLLLELVQEALPHKDFHKVEGIMRLSRCIKAAEITKIKIRVMVMLWVMQCLKCRKLGHLEVSHSNRKRNARQKCLPQLPSKW